MTRDEPAARIGRHVLRERRRPIRAARDDPRDPGARELARWLDPRGLTLGKEGRGAAALGLRAIVLAVLADGRVGDEAPNRPGADLLGRSQRVEDGAPRIRPVGADADGHPRSPVARLFA